MKKQYRQAIFIAFLIFFIISIPLLLIYTAGYRYNFKKNKLEKTGTLLVSLKTEDATLYLDERAYQIKDTLRIKNLLSDDYNIKISKSGYFDWQKKLSVESELTTFIKDLRLIKNNLPSAIINLPIKNFYPSLKKEKLAYYYYDKKTASYPISVINLSDEKITAITQLSQLPLNVEWAPDNNKFFVQTSPANAGGFKIFDLKSGEVSLSFIKAKMTELQWDEKNSFILYAKMSDGIYKIDLLFKTYSKLYSSKSINDFLVSQNDVYVIEAGYLKEISQNGGDVISIPLERKDYQISKIINKKIFILSPAGKMQIFYLPLEKTSTPILLVNANNFDLYGDNLLFGNDFEIWEYNFTSSDKNLITRISSNIKKALWANGTDYIIFLSDNKIRLIETDKRDERQIFDAASLDNISNPMLSDQTLYFTGQINGSTSLYKLEI